MVLSVTMQCKLFRMSSLKKKLKVLDLSVHVQLVRTRRLKSLVTLPASILPDHDR